MPWSEDVAYWVIILLAGLLIVDTKRALETAFLVAARRQCPYALWQAYDAWARPIGAIVGVLCLGPSAEAVLLGYLLASLGGLVWFRPTFIREQSFTDTEEPALSTLDGEIRRYALPLVPLAIVGWVNSLGDRYIIGHFMGLEWMGIYAAAYGLISRPFLMVGRIAGQTLKPIYFDAFEAGNRQRQQQVFRLWLAVTGSISVLGVFMIWLLSRQVASLLLAEKFRAGVILIPWIATGYACYVMATVFEAVLYARKQTKQILLLQSMVAAFSLVAAVIGVKCFGMTGAAMACPAAFGGYWLLAIGFASNKKSKPQATQTGDPIS